MTQPTIEQVKNYAAKIALRALQPRDNGKEPPLLKSIDHKALYTYKSLEGVPLHYRLRLKCNSNGDKYICPIMWDGSRLKQKEPPAPDTGKPLYGLERLPTHPEAVVIITEGEYAADALNKAFHQWGALGFVALTSGSASSAAAADWQPLAGRSVYVFPDNDTAGAKYGVNVVQALQGIAHSAAVLDIAPLSLPHKGDAVEWLEGEGDLDGLLVLLDATRHNDQPPLNPDVTVTTENPLEQGLQGDGDRDNAQPEGTSKPAEAVETEAEIIARMASLSPLAYDRARKGAADYLKVSATALDKAIALEKREGKTDSGIGFEDCEPYPHPINPAELLSELSDTVKRFIVCSDETADAAALWAAFTWFIDVVEVAPIAVITAPEKRCGKSMLLFLLGKLSYRPLTASNISPAALFRTVDAWKPTLLIDEADAFMRDNEELRGLKSERINLPT